MKLVLVKGTSFVCRLIRWQTRSPYSHAAIIDDDGIVYEAVGSGVRSWNLRSGKFTGSYDVFDVPTNDDQHNDVRAFLWRQLGKRYDFRMVLRFISRESEPAQSKQKWFCSELVFAAFQAAGINLFERTQAWEVSPGLLARTPLAFPVTSPALQTPGLSQAA